MEKSNSNKYHDYKDYNYIDENEKENYSNNSNITITLNNIYLRHIFKASIYARYYL